MEIPEVKDLTMTALGHDHIKVGCVEFALSSIKSYRNATTTMGAMVFWHCQYPYWLTLADCDRALRLMNEYQEPKAIPPAKFEIGQQVRCRCNHHHGQNPYRVEYKKLVQEDYEFWLPRIGDWVRCTEPSHKGPNPFRINLDDTHRIYGGSSEPHSSQYYGCKPEWLVPASLQEPCRGQTEEPRGETPPRDHWQHLEDNSKSGTDLRLAVLELRHTIENLRREIGKK